MMEAATTISRVAYDEGRRLAADPNIRAVGYGAKLRGGLPVGADTLIFYVVEKLRSREDIAARGSWAVTGTVAGFATDVVEIGRIAPATADRTPPAGSRGAAVADPLLGGVATAGLGAAPSGSGGYGTIGGVCFDQQTNSPLMLSNAHVWGQTAGVEIIQPVTPTAVFGAAVSTAVIGQPSMLVQARVPSGLTAPTVFASSFGQTYLVTGGDTDPLAVGQAAAPVPAGTRTDSEEVGVSAPVAGLPPAGRRLSPNVAWTYSRFASTAVSAASSNGPRTQPRLLAARRLFTGGASFSSGQTINLYAEVVPAAGGTSAVAASHFVLVLLYPPAGDRFVPRVLRATARQTVATLTASFAGFSAPPARTGAVTLPVVAPATTGIGTFTVDGDPAGTFVTPPAGTLPSGKLALSLGNGSIRVFVPPSTGVDLDIDLRNTTGFQATAVNSAGDVVATATVGSGTAGRSLVTASASEIVELRLTGAANAQIFGATSRRASPETTPAPMSYAGTVLASDLIAVTKGRWGASLFVQSLDTAVPESANVIETAIGVATLIADAQFDLV